MKSITAQNMKFLNTLDKSCQPNDFKNFRFKNVSIHSGINLRLKITLSGIHRPRRL